MVHFRRAETAEIFKILGFWVLVHDGARFDSGKRAR